MCETPARWGGTPARWGHYIIELFGFYMHPPATPPIQVHSDEE